MSMLNMLLGASGGIADLKVGFSGNSIAIIGTERNMGLQASGMSYRHYHYIVDDDPADGAWCTVSNRGVFSGNSIDSQGLGIIASGNLLQSNCSGYGASGFVTFDLATKTFSGSSTVASGSYVLQTSGGLLRVGTSFMANFFGSYISLT